MTPEILASIRRFHAQHDGDDRAGCESCQLLALIDAGATCSQCGTTGLLYCLACGELRIEEEAAARG